MVLRKLLSGILLLACSFMHSQVTFTELPVNFQLIPRITANSGTFTVSGKNLSAGSYHLKSRLVETLNPLTVIEEKTVTTDAMHDFSIQHVIPSQLKEYDLQIYVFNGLTDSLLQTVERLVCGDYFIICGQSNALAPENYSDSTNNHRCLRGIGTNEDPFDSHFPCSYQAMYYRPATAFWLWNGFVGTWGIKLQRDLAEYNGIPTCIINGARGGSSIRQNLASHTPSKPGSIDSCIAYDRLYQKIAHYRLNTAIKALFWYQGETDGIFSMDSTCEYMNTFDRLYASWKADYPNLEKIILVQVNTGCNDKNLAVVREQQRKISYRYPDIAIMSSFSPDTADRTGDNCHSSFKGYCKLADNLLPLIKKYIYKEALDDNKILPPKIVRAYCSTTSQVCLEFDKAITVEQYKEYKRNQKAYIKDYFYGEDFSDLNLLSVSATDKNVYLDFATGAKLPKYVTYLPNSFTKIPTLYTGPWILNAQNTKLTALSFYNYPVAPVNNEKWIVNNTGPCSKASITFSDLVAYPNPAKNEITLSLYETNTHTTIMLIDTQGKLVLVLKDQNTAFVTLNVSLLERGLYFLKTDNARGASWKKIIVQ